MCDNLEEEKNNIQKRIKQKTKRDNLDDSEKE